VFRGLKCTGHRRRPKSPLPTSGFYHLHQSINTSPRHPIPSIQGLHNMEKEGLERYQPPVAHLFVLSRELRDQIYRYVLAGKKWSIDAEGRLQHQPPNSLALAQVCQQLYMETRLIPFTSSTFHTSSPDGWRHLCDRIALTQKESVTSVELDMGVCGQFRAYHDNAIFPRQSAWRIDNGLSMHECTGLKRLHEFLEIKDW